MTKRPSKRGAKTAPAKKPSTKSAASKAGPKASAKPDDAAPKVFSTEAPKVFSAEAMALAVKRMADKAKRDAILENLKTTTEKATKMAEQSGATATGNINLGAGAGPGAQGAQQGGAAAQAGFGADKVALLGNAVWLLTQTPTHKHLFITDLEWLVIPPVALDQFRLWRQGNLPVAFATWAYLSEEAEERLKQGVRRLSPMDWKSGENLWLMDMIAPFGGSEEAMKELREKILPGKKIKTLQPAPSGEGMAVVEW